MAREVVLVRHGQTEWSRDHRHTGRTDIPLTEVGRTQADLSAEVFRGRSFGLVLSSPLQRAAETCERAGLGATAVAEPGLMEWDYGEAEGLTTAEMQAGQPGWTVWADPPGLGESLADVGARTDAVLGRVLAAQADGADVVLVAHGHLLRILAARWLGLEPAAGRLLTLDTASISTLGHEHGNQVLRRWNDVSHLRSEAG